MDDDLKPIRLFSGGGVSPSPCLRVIVVRVARVFRVVIGVMVALVFWCYRY